MKILSAVPFGLACHAGAQPPETQSPSSPTVEAEAASSNAAPAFPVWWSEELGLASLSDAEAALSRPDPSAFGELSSDSDVRRPHHCIEWNRLHALGYEPTTTREAQPDAGARVHCETLALLTRARPATSSTVRDFSLADADILSMLPAVVATAESNEDGAARDSAQQEGLSFARLDPRAKVVGIEDGTLRVMEGFGQSMIVVRLLARGDFDADGRDDVVVSLVNAMTRGTLSSSRVVVLTRDNPGAVLRPLPVSPFGAPG